MLNNPGMLREYVSVTNDPNMINVNRNREIINENIRKIKEQNKKEFTGADITEGSITGKQMMENLRKALSNPKTYNPFSTYQVKPNPDLFIHLSKVLNVYNLNIADFDYIYKQDGQWPLEPVFKNYIENNFDSLWGKNGEYFHSNHPTDKSHIEWGNHLYDYIKENYELF